MVRNLSTVKLAPDGEIFLDCGNEFLDFVLKFLDGEVCDPVASEDKPAACKVTLLFVVI